MKTQEARALRASVEALLDQTLALYSQILKATDERSRTPVRVQELFSRPIDEPRETTIAPYEPIVPHICFGYDSNTQLAAKLLESQHEQPLGPARTQNQLRIVLDDPAESTWFTFEIEIPWTEIRLAERLRATLATKASERIAADLKLFGYDKKGERLELAEGEAVLPDQAAVVTANLSIRLPQETFLDFDREPTLVFFFELKPFSLDVDYLVLATA